VAEEQLAGLASRMREEAGANPYAPRSDPGEEGSSSAALAELVDMAQAYNHKLSWYRYASNPRDRSNPTRNSKATSGSWPAREPLPDELPLTDIKRFTIGPKGRSVRTSRKSPWVSDEEWDRIPRFYSEAIAALESHSEVVGSSDDRYIDDDDDEANQRNFARSLVAPRDGASGWKTRAAQERLDRRLERYRYRRDFAIKRIGSGVRGRQTHDGTAEARDATFLCQVVSDDLTDGDESLPIFVLRVHAEAHLSMHAVEAWRSMCLGEHADAGGAEERAWLNEELKRSIALSTFAFCVSRTAPWIFAKSDEERLTVMRDVPTAWENVVPTRCMWIASQISLLSLHRRAYARAIKDDPTGAYNDYHKLQYLIRDTERRVRAGPLHVEGALEFLAGLNAEAHHHIGELYRSEHAHKPALEHFKAASHRLELLRKESIGDRILTNSRWYVELQISHGKACYEMGRHKESLFWHLRAWQAFLELLSSETKTDTNTEDIEKAIEWLESVKFEPELRKSEISERLRPVVDQLDRITMVGRVGALAAEILLRLGHLLFVLNVGFRPQAQQGSGRGEVASARERIRGTLAYGCLVKASECDPYSTLVGADLLKTRYRFNSWPGELSRAEREILEPEPLEPVKKHWPRGGDDYERLARVAEYLMLKARKDRFEEGVVTGSQKEADALLARDLLLDLFMSTDSINVRKSQIHRFLMRLKLSDGLPREHRSPAIEFVCMRRYSSPFPLLPRPSAFRALGGGYFIRLHGKADEDGEADPGPYGIVVDPGVDFVENLYRTGYSLSDIDMIVITHDHVDHLGALDPLLSLLHVRAEILSKQERADNGSSKAGGPSTVKVLTSRSVERRYADVKRLVSDDSKEFRFICFEDLMEVGGVLRKGDFFEGFPPEFEILAMSSAAGAENERKGGHRDLSDEPSHGLCFRVTGGAGASVAFTSDTPPPPSARAKGRRQRWREVWEPALTADILVAHLGSVPLTELRRMDNYEKRQQLERERAGADPLPEQIKEEEELGTLQDLLQEANGGLQGQVEYAQWLRSHDPGGGPAIEPAGLVGPVSSRWLPPPEHNYLAGLLRWAREYEKRWSSNGGTNGAAEPQGLFVVGELSEELGTMRGKVAARLNDRVFEVDRRRQTHDEKDPSVSAPIGFPYALTADIGLHACVTSDEKEGSRVEVLCTNCNLDTDRAPDERYHSAHDVYEVCVKGENEGVFYNCLEHDPARQDEPAFLEQLERFDIFGR
jgi:hypothetical protein